MEIEKKIIKIPLWSVKRRTLSLTTFLFNFNRPDKYYAYAVGQGLDIFKNADDFKAEKAKYYLEKNELVHEAESQVKSQFHFLANAQFYENAYKNNQKELFPSNEHWSDSNTIEDLWYLFKMDSIAYEYIYTFLREKFLIKELTYANFHRMVKVGMIEVDFIELDVTEYEREYSSFKAQNLTQNKKMALKQEKDRLRKINAGVLCGQCGSEKTMVVEYPHNEYQEAKIVCRNCANIWSTSFQRKII